MDISPQHHLRLEFVDLVHNLCFLFRLVDQFTPEDLQ